MSGPAEQLKNAEHLDPLARWRVGAMVTSDFLQQFVSNPAKRLRGRERLLIAQREDSAGRTASLTITAFRDG
jgi:hypothetical protein